MQKTLFCWTTSLKFSTGYSRAKSLERPQEVVSFFKGLGLSDARVQSIARAVPSILFADVEKTLKPKVRLFQELGLSTLIKKVLVSDGRYRSEEQVNGDLLRVLTRCSTIFYMTSRLEANIVYLESSLVQQPNLLSLSIKERVSPGDTQVEKARERGDHLVGMLLLSYVGTPPGLFEQSIVKKSTALSSPWRPVPWFVYCVARSGEHICVGGIWENLQLLLS
ncbi:hypothetical protein SASPL_141195 [Salvia splendens]|uniref:Uncharacterized protein n=1 Tax=Salvia splendens TaxID=180675 RepID=A0A8X8WT82_SALSN|nr:hypothetical protein SASPL_141195 [Salvia splendens]